MIVKTTFKSHFKIKKNLKSNLKKKIFVKNIVVFLLFTKIFFKKCSISFLFFKNRKNQTNLLKAPSRHKKFFHQIFYEFFQIKVFFKFLNLLFNAPEIIPIYKDLNKVFLKVGSNILTRTKFLVIYFVDVNVMI